MKVCSECTISGTKENVRFQTCRFRYLVGHPEMFLEKQAIDVMDLWGSKVDWIVIDEAHCVSKWGTEFRPAFQRLESLRAIFPTARVITMTAIATEKTKKDLVSYLLLKDPDCITSSINRQTIMLIVKKRKPRAGGENTVEGNVADILAPLSQELITTGSLFPKTVVFTKFNWCGFGYEYVVSQFIKESRRSGLVSASLGRDLVS